jgi:tRNA-specific 2-thiouridylase
VSTRVVVAMSGGVDSSVCAALLHARGYDCIGVTMKLWDGPEAAQGHQKTCCTLDDVSDARRVADQFGIPFYVANFKDPFARHVIDDFISSYQRGYTPNPCAQCNRHLKFAALQQRAQQLGADYVATGHYASVVCADDGRYRIRRGKDAGKDQSYFLFDLSQEQLGHAMFPLGAFSKDAVRDMASQFGLKVAAKAESQEICFVPDGDYRTFLRPRLEADAFHPGPIVDTSGKVLGKHQGLPFYTVGQRRGLGIAAAQPLHVVSVRPADNTLVVGTRDETTRDAFAVERCNWMRTPPDGPLDTTVQIRYRQRPVPATVHPVNDAQVQVELREPQFAVSPGQAAVFYDRDTVIGGGWIARHVR